MFSKNQTVYYRGWLKHKTVLNIAWKILALLGWLLDIDSVSFHSYTKLKSETNVKHI